MISRACGNPGSHNTLLSCQQMKHYKLSSELLWGTTWVIQYRYIMRTIIYLLKFTKLGLITIEVISNYSAKFDRANINEVIDAHI